MSVVYDGERAHLEHDLSLMVSIDHGIQRSRRLRVLVNPNGGVVRSLLCRLITVLIRPPI